MKIPKELRDWDFSDWTQLLGRHDMESIPDLTRYNFNKLIEEHNNLVEVVNLLLDKACIVFDK